MKPLSSSALLLALLASLTLGPGSRVQAQELGSVSGKGPQRARPDLGKGLAWLGRQQALESGSWGQNNKLALTGMSGLALLASGSTPRRGPYARHIQGAIRFVLRCQEGDRKAFTHQSSGYSAIHNHGYALLFLTQAFGEGGPLDDKLREAITLGVQATLQSQFTQGIRNGGFGYFLYLPEGAQRIPSQHRHMWKDDEASTTISQIQALRGARNAGFRVHRLALERAADYIARSQHLSGGFLYSLGNRRVSMHEGSEEPTFAISAACTAVLQALGTYEGPKVEAGLDYLERFIPPARGKIPFFYYAHYYAAQVMHLVGGSRGRRWLEAIREELASRQRADGRWSADPEDTLAEQDSQILNTAWALQISLIDAGALPLHER